MLTSLAAVKQNKIFNRIQTSIYRPWILKLNELIIIWYMLNQVYNQISPILQINIRLWNNIKTTIVIVVFQMLERY